MADPIDIRRSLYTRQELAALTGVDDSSLNYWMREGLLQPSEGGGGKGRHRRFDFMQVNIAAIFATIQPFRLNIGALRTLAELLQTAARFGAAHELHPESYRQAARLATDLARYSSGEIIEVYANEVDANRPEGLSRTDLTKWSLAKRPASSEQEVIASHLRGNTDYNSAEEILAVANRIGPNRDSEAALYAELVFQVLAPGYSGETSWLLGLNDDGNWRIEFGNEGKFFENIYGATPDDFGAAIFVPVYGVFRKMWGLKSLAEYRREWEAEQITEALAAAGIRATITLHENEEDGFAIDAGDVPLDEINAALPRRFKLMHPSETEQ